MGHSLGIGVDVDTLPEANDVDYVAHGTALSAAKSISEQGLTRADRVHVHFLQCTRGGQIYGNQRVRSGSQALVIASARTARDDGIRFYRPSSNVILSDGIDGVIPPRFIRSIKLLPTYDLLWTNEDRVWEVPAPEVNGNPFNDFETDNEELTAIVETPNVGSGSEEPNFADIATRTYDDDERSARSSEHSGFPD